MKLSNLKFSRILFFSICSICLLSSCEEEVDSDMRNNETLFSEMQEALGVGNSILGLNTISYDAIGVAYEFQEDPQKILLRL